MRAMEWPAPNEVHVWSVDLDRPAAQLAGALSEDELLRAAAFKVEDGRRNFVATRGALRILVGRYLDEDPAAIRFTVAKNGKPGLVHPSLLQFNVSHSGDVALIVVGHVEVGVDVEQIKLRHDLTGLAKR